MNLLIDFQISSALTKGLLLFPNEFLFKIGLMRSLTVGSGCLLTRLPDLALATVASLLRPIASSVVCFNPTNTSNGLKIFGLEHTSSDQSSRNRIWMNQRRIGFSSPPIWQKFNQPIKRVINLIWKFVLLHSNLFKFYSYNRKDPFILEDTFKEFFSLSPSNTKKSLLIHC